MKCVGNGTPGSSREKGRLQELGFWEMQAVLAVCWAEAALAGTAPPLPPALRGTASVSLDPF